MSSMFSEDSLKALLLPLRLSQWSLRGSYPMGLFSLWVWESRMFSMGWERCGWAITTSLQMWQSCCEKGACRLCLALGQQSSSIRQYPPYSLQKQIVPTTASLMHSITTSFTQLWRQLLPGWATTAAKVLSKKCSLTKVVRSWGSAISLSLEAWIQILMKKYSTRQRAISSCALLGLEGVRYKASTCWAKVRTSLRRNQQMWYFLLCSIFQSPQKLLEIEFLRFMCVMLRRTLVFPITCPSCLSSSSTHLRHRGTIQMLPFCRLWLRVASSWSSCFWRVQRRERYLFWSACSSIFSVKNLQTCCRPSSQGSWASVPTASLTPSKQ